MPAFAGVFTIDPVGPLRCEVLRAITDPDLVDANWQQYAPICENGCSAQLFKQFTLSNHAIVAAAVGDEQVMA